MSKFNFKESIKRNGKAMCKEFRVNTIYRAIGYCIGTAVLVGVDAYNVSKATKKEGAKK